MGSRRCLRLCLSHGSSPRVATQCASLGVIDAFGGPRTLRLDTLLAAPTAGCTRSPKQTSSTLS